MRERENKKKKMYQAHWNFLETMAGCDGFIAETQHLPIDTYLINHIEH